MVRTAQVGRRLTQKRQERRCWQQAVQHVAQSAHAPQTVTNPAVHNPTGTDKPFYETATTEEWLAVFTEWTQRHRALPALPEQNHSRAYFYEDLKC